MGGGGDAGVSNDWCITLRCTTHIQWNVLHFRYMYLEQMETSVVDFVMQNT